uniref:Solute carrier family 47 member 4 n=1 Tax=Hippocampus comes TaxID=109280 RepID=A0A3Q3E2M8_HIPCM
MSKLLPASDIGGFFSVFSSDRMHFPCFFDRFVITYVSAPYLRLCLAFGSRSACLAPPAGFSLESLQEWGSFMELAIPSTLMTCFEWWIYEFGGFFAGMLGNVELAVQHALISVANLNYMVTLGIQAATCARVGNALGCGDTAGAILTCKVALFLSGQAVSILLGATKSVVGLLFTSDPNIINLLSHLMSIYCFQQLFDGIVGVSAGIFMGTGKQKIGAVANFIGHYCIGLSVGIVLMFVYKLNILGVYPITCLNTNNMGVIIFEYFGCFYSAGFWVGLLISVVLQSAFYIVVIFKLNWKSITDEVQVRAVDEF